jgi:hypothetical protein
VVVGSRRAEAGWRSPRPSRRSAPLTLDSNHRGLKSHEALPRLEIAVGLHASEYVGDHRPGCCPREPFALSVGTP